MNEKASRRAAECNNRASGGGSALFGASTTGDAGGVNPILKAFLIAQAHSFRVAMRGDVAVYPNVESGGMPAQDTQSEANEETCPPLPPTIFSPVFLCSFGCLDVL